MLTSAGSSSKNAVVARTEKGIETILVTVYTHDPDPVVPEIDILNVKADTF